MNNIITRFKDFFSYPLFELGGSSFTLGTIFYLLISMALLIFISGIIKKWMVKGLLARNQTDLGVRVALGTIVRYIFVFIGFIVVLQTAGIDLSSLTILAGAFGIGIGFGLQNITNNFVSGMIILLERPIKVGDRIEVGEITGEVVKISLRATTVQTNDNISFIVPNSEFTMTRVVNWSYSDRNIRLHLPVGVSYNSDPEQVKKLLLEVTGEHKGILKEPAPDVIFIKYGNSSLDFELRIWTTDYIRYPFILKSDLYFAIWKKFKEHRIEIPYTQHDLHIRSGTLQVKQT